MRNFFSILFVTLSVMYTIKGSVSGNSYHKYCRSNLLGDQNCFFTVAYWFNFVDFRQWLDKLSETVGDVSLNIHCYYGAYIYLPFPFRARHLKKLHIKNCLIRMYLSEWKAPKKYPDTLEDLLIANSEISIDLPSMEEVITTPLTKQTDCGQETLQRMAMRNVTVKPIIKEPTSEKILNSFETFTEKMKSVKYMCDYKHLYFLERSGDGALNKNFMDIYTEKGHYPRLKTIKMSSNNLVNFPEQFTNWQEYFPTLHQLDLSNNSIANFTFNNQMKSSTNYVPLVVNLKQNYIRTLPSNIELYLSHSPIILDIRENPIECDCGAERLGKYLREVRRRFPLYKPLTEYVCESPAQVKGVKLIYINYEKCSQL